MNLLLTLPWFWTMTVAIGFLLALCSVLIGIGFEASLLVLPLLAIPLLLRAFHIHERCKAVALTAVISYLFLLVILLTDPAFPTAQGRLLEFIQTIAITVPAFILRAPLYEFAGIQHTEIILGITSIIFAIFFWRLSAALDRVPAKIRKGILYVLILSMFITCIECYQLGKGIRKLHEIPGLEPSVRNYYRIVVNS